MPNGNEGARTNHGLNIAAAFEGWQACKTFIREVQNGITLSAQKGDAASEGACGCSWENHMTGSLSNLLQAMCLLDAQVQHLQLLMQHTAAEIWPRQSIAISLCSCCTDSWHSRVLLPVLMVAWCAWRWGHSGQQAALIPTALTQVAHKALPEACYCSGIAEAHDMQSQPVPTWCQLSTPQSDPAEACREHCWCLS